MSLLVKIALGTLKIAFLSFGGGNAVMGMIKLEFVQKYKMITDDDFSRIFSLANMFPGPLIVNTVSLIGYKAGGFLGGIISFILILFPGPILVTLFVAILHQYVSGKTLLKISLGVTPVIIALLLDFMIKSYKNQKNTTPSLSLYFCMFIITLILLFLDVNIALVFFVCILTIYSISFFKTTIKQI